MALMKFFGTVSQFYANLTALNTANSSTAMGSVTYSAGDSIVGAGTPGSNPGDLGVATGQTTTGILNFSANTAAEYFNLSTVTGAALIYGTTGGYDTIWGGTGADTIWGSANSIIHGSGASSGNVIHAAQGDTIDASGSQNVAYSYTKNGSHSGTSNHATSIMAGTTTIYGPANGTAYIHMNSAADPGYGDSVAGSTIVGGYAGSVHVTVSGAGDNVINTGAGKDNIVTITNSGSQNDPYGTTINGGSGAVTVVGGGIYNDQIIFGSGAGTYISQAANGGEDRVTCSSTTKDLIKINIFDADYSWSYMRNTTVVISNFNHLLDTIDFLGSAGPGHYSSINGVTLAQFKAGFTHDESYNFGSHAVSESLGRVEIVFLGMDSPPVIGNSFEMGK